MKNALQVLLFALAFAPTQLAHADDDDDDEHEGYERHSARGDEGGRSGLAPGVAPVTDPLTAKECGSCHMAYPAGLLPARSWITLMGNLSNHYGDDASLPAEQVQAISGWLVKQAADTRPDHALAARIARAVPPDQTPLRILEIPWLRHEHGEISPQLLQQAGVTSLSACASCHPGAAEGRFGEREIMIPGVGRYDD